MSKSKQTENAKRWTLIDVSGRNIDGSKLEFSNVIISLDSYFFSVQLETYGSYHIYDGVERRLVYCQDEFQQIFGFYCGYSKVKKNGKYGVINTKGEIIVPLIYDDIFNHCGRYDRATIDLVIEGKAVGVFDFRRGIVIPK